MDLPAPLERFRDGTLLGQIANIAGLPLHSSTPWPRSTRDASGMLSRVALHCRSWRPVIENSPKYQALIILNMNIFGVWNVQGLTRPGSKLSVARE